MSNSVGGVQWISWALPGPGGIVIEQDSVSQGGNELSQLRPPLECTVLVWVWSVRRFYYVDRSCNLPADGISIVRARDFGRWIASGAGDLHWQDQTAWYYDATIGTAENPGTAAQPISSMAELYRRVDGGIVLTPVTLDVVGGVGALSASEAASLDALTAGPRPWTVNDV